MGDGAAQDEPKKEKQRYDSSIDEPDYCDEMSCEEEERKQKEAQKAKQEADEIASK